jgi:hypothetical protein
MNNGWIITDQYTTNMYVCNLFFSSHSGEWSPSWVHSARRPLNGLLYPPRVIMMMENLVEWRRQEKPKYSEKTCPSATLSTTNPTWPDKGLNLGRRAGKPATNRLSYGAVMYICMYVCMYVRYFELLRPYTSVPTVMCFQRSVRLSPPAASVDHFLRRRNRAVFRVLQAGRSGMPGAGGRLRLPSLGTESTTSNSSSQGSGGVSQLQKEQHRVVVMGWATPHLRNRERSQLTRSEWRGSQYYDCVLLGCGSV